MAAPDIKHNPVTGAVTVTIAFTTGLTLKAGLSKGAIQQHLLMEAAQECARAGAKAISGKSSKDFDDEADAAKASIDADVAAKKASMTITGDVKAT